MTAAIALLSPDNVPGEPRVIGVLGKLVMKVTLSGVLAGIEYAELGD